MQFVPEGVSREFGKLDDVFYRTFEASEFHWAQP